MTQTAPRPTQPVDNGPLEQPRQNSQSQNVEATDANLPNNPERQPEVSNENKSSMSAVDLWKEGGKMLGSAGDGILRQLGFAPSGDMLPANDEATLSQVQKAVRGNETAAINEKAFMDMKGPYQQRSFREGDFKNVKDASVKLNDKGQVTDFTTAPAQAHSEGVSYKNIKYDENGAIKSFDTPWNTTISRISAPDANGYAKWQNTNKQGQLVNYKLCRIRHNLYYPE